MAQPTRTISRSTLESTCVTIEGVEHRADVRDGRVFVAGRASPWAQVSADRVEVTLGAKVPELLTRAVDPKDHERTLAAAIVIAGAVGHPRQNPRGRPIRFVWTDHVALGAGREAPLALRHSHVRDEQAEHIARISGRVEVRRCD